MQTPWGESDSSKDLGCGVTSVATPSHGGLHIADPSILPSDVMATFSNGPNWAEEDCEGALVLALLYDSLDTSPVTSWSKEAMIKRAREIGEKYQQYAPVLKHLPE